MTDQLNIEKLKIYNSYGGDIDGICRNNRSTEKAVFGDSLDSTRTLISLKLQDIELISKRLTSYDYKKSSLTELYEKSDAETYKLFVRLSFQCSITYFQIANFQQDADLSCKASPWNLSGSELCRQA